MKLDTDGYVITEEQGQPTQWLCLRCHTLFEACGKCYSPRIDIEVQRVREFLCDQCWTESPGFREMAEGLADRYSLPGRDGLDLLQRTHDRAILRTKDRSADEFLAHEAGNTRIAHFHRQAKRVIKALATMTRLENTESESRAKAVPGEDRAQTVKRFHKYGAVAQVLLDGDLKLSAAEVAERLDNLHAPPPDNFKSWREFHKRETEQMDKLVSRIKTRLKTLTLH